MKFRIKIVLMKNNRLNIINELKEKLFDVYRWPHYELMFDHMDKIIQKINQEDKIAIIERCYIYNGYSIFSSLFEIGELNIFDFIPPSSQNESRQNYQFDKLNDLPETRKTIRKSLLSVNSDNLYNQISLGEKFDYIFIPNVLHHYPNPFDLFKICFSALKKGGFLYVFDATLRENHQQPDDFMRFTTHGIINCLETSGFDISEISTSKSPVEALTYTIDQVIQYDLPDELIKEISNLNDIIKGKYKSTLTKNFNNKQRKYTSFPVAYSVLAIKN